jgi:hypothetical protein
VGILITVTAWVETALDIATAVRFALEKNFSLERSRMMSAQMIDTIHKTRSTQHDLFRYHFSPKDSRSQIRPRQNRSPHHRRGGRSLGDKAKVIYSEMIRCAPAQFDNRRDTLIADWKSSGAQAVIDEHRAKCPN